MPKYDLAVVGAGLGGLAAASLASRMNKKTIVLEPGDAVGGALASFQKNEFVFYPGPRLSFGFERGGVLQQLNETLGIVQNASLRSPCYQVALPNRRITVYAEQSETLDELNREFPNEIDKISKFYRDLRRQSLRNSKSRISAFLSGARSARAFLSSYRFSREFRTFLDVQSYYFFRNPAGALPLVGLITLCDSAPLTVEYGFKKTAEQMVNVLLKCGGEIRYQVPLSEITVKKGAVSIGDQKLEADAILINREHDQQIPFLCLAVREDVIPVGMLPEVFCVPDYAHADRFFTVSVSDRNDEAVAPRGTLSITAKFQTFIQSPEDRVNLVKTLIPFLDEFLLFVQESIPAPETPVLDKDISMKAIEQGLLSRTSQKGVYVLVDAGTPAQSITAARRFIELIR